MRRLEGFEKQQDHVADLKGDSRRMRPREAGVPRGRALDGRGMICRGTREEAGRQLGFS